MGIVWEAYHKGVPLLGVPENPIELMWGAIQNGHDSSQRSFLVILAQATRPHKYGNFTFFKFIVFCFCKILICI